jgi:oligopeptidase B
MLMIRHRAAWIVATSLALAACSAGPPAPPVARQDPHVLTEHGHERVDPYYWLRHPDDPEVIGYLEAENAYTDAVMRSSTGLQERLYEEITGRLDPAEASVPYLDGGFWYAWRYEPGSEYPVYTRRPEGPDGDEVAILDVNRIAVGHDYCDVDGLDVSPDGRLLAWGVDTVGRRKYDLHVRDLEHGEDLADVIPTVTPNLAWAADGQTLFYVRQDPETLRSYQVLRHVLGSPVADDVVVYEEPDPTYSVSVHRSKSDRWLMIVAEQTEATEVRVLPADEPAGAWRVVEPRQRGHEYHVAHHGDDFVIRTNRDAEGFRLVTAPVADPGRVHWRELLPSRPGVLLEDVEVFSRHYVTRERSGGVERLRVARWDGSDAHDIAFDEPSYVVWIGDNAELDSDVLRFGYSSLTTPKSVYDYDMEGRERRLLKRDDVLGGFDPRGYVTERLEAVADDGVSVPISLVRRRDTALDGSAPALLYGYGAYGYSSEPWFRPEIVSLLDRGFVWAIAHVRGGQELGREWYEQGRLEHKRNTFTDFIACAHHLVEAGYTSPDRLFASGGSAGGLLVGAVANMAPELFAGILAHVPWVDVVTTMLDESIPLTTAEYDEWGDPRRLEDYQYMLSYSPYDNVTAQGYPAMLVITSLHDSQVQYWEPAKWVAKLRATKTDDNLLLLRTHMISGHGGPSGRYSSYRDDALDYAFMLRVLGRDG